MEGEARWGGQQPLNGVLCALAARRGEASCALEGHDQCT
jgi:hypothetical protein